MIEAKTRRSLQRFRRGLQARPDQDKRGFVSGRRINVTQLIDERGFSQFQFLVALWGGFLILLDGFDIAPRLMWCR